MFGQAIGDALGLGSEFMDKNEVIKHYPDGLRYYSQIIKDVHRSRWAKGSWTDDTDMMLCILDGHTNNVLCMGDYVEQPEMCSKLWWNISRQKSAANGALMRTSVVGLATSDIEEQAIAICKLTHYDPRCVGSCVIATAIINNLVWNEDLLSYDDIKSIARKYDDRIIEWIDAAYNSQNIFMLDLDEPYSMGYTLRTLSAALWCYWHSPSFEEGLFSVVNEGGDADTNAAVACAILGAKFGYDVIPKYYIENLHNEPMYRNVVQNFINQVLNAEREIG